MTEHVCKRCRRTKVTADFPVNKHGRRLVTCSQCRIKKHDRYHTGQKVGECHQLYACKTMGDRPEWLEWLRKPLHRIAPAEPETGSEAITEQYGGIE